MQSSRASWLAITLAVIGASGVAPAGQGKRDPEKKPQSSQIVAFSDKDDPKPDPKPDAPKPDSPAPDRVDPRRPPLGAIAQVTPPSPHIVSNAVVIPGRKSSGGYTTQSVVASRLAIASPYGFRTHPITGEYRLHTGVDFKASFGESVGASMGGRVAFAGPRNGYGNLVVVDHGSGISTYYAHLSAFAVTAEQTVASGQIVGYVGSTGRSTGPHLHYELRIDGHPLNPFSILSMDGNGFFVDGRRYTPSSGDSPAYALPPAPGGTEIAVDWGDTPKDGAKPTPGTRIAVDLE